MSEKPNRYDDYQSQAFTAVEAAYVIGTAAYSADNAVFGTGATRHTRLVANSVLLLATQNCYVRFNGASRVQHFLHANVYYTFNRVVTSIRVVRATNDGTLEIWSEGNMTYRA